MKDEEVFWVVWNPGSGSPKFRHPTESAARAESERLAETNPGSKFYVLRALGVAVVERPAVYTKLSDGLPF